MQVSNLEIARLKLAISQSTSINFCQKFHSQNPSTQLSKPKWKTTSKVIISSSDMVQTAMFSTQEWARDTKVISKRSHMTKSPQEKTIRPTTSDLDLTQDQWLKTMSRLSCRKSWAHTPVATTASKANTKEFTEQGLLMGKFQPEPKTGISHEKMTFKKFNKNWNFKLFNL